MMFSYTISRAVWMCFLIALSLSQDILDGLTTCQRAKSSCTLYAAQHQRLTDLEERYKEALKRLDNLEKPKGLVGSSPVAFSAKKVKSENVTADIIKFEDVLLNQGNAYNSVLGKFTAPVNGIYVFSWTIVTEQNFAIGTELVVNNNMKAYGWTDARKSNGNVDDSGSSTITLQLKKLDVVFVRTMPRWNHYVSGSGWSSFTGWKIGV